MTVFSEGRIEFSFPTAVRCEAFDTPSTHFLSHCLKAVDYIVELPDRILFLEVKDPQHPDAQSAQVEAFVVELTTERLIEDSLRPKCNDSLLYKLAVQQIDRAKPLFYVVLIALDTLGAPELDSLTVSLRKRLPIVEPDKGVWRKFAAAGQCPTFVQGCMVCNIEAWNKRSVCIGGSVRRLP